MIRWLLDKARKGEFIDKLGRKWRWDASRKKYVYVAKGNRKAKQEQTSERNKKIIMAVKMGASVRDLSKEIGLSKYRLRDIIRGAIKRGEVEGYAKVKSTKVNIKELFSYESRKLNGKSITDINKDTQAKNQPYRDKGIVIGRSGITILPKKNYVSDDILAGLRDHQSDFINLAMDKFASGQKAMINSDGTGPQPLSSKVCTSKGWKLMKDITLQDKVITVDGLPSKILSIKNYGYQDIYEMQTTSKAKAKCALSHLWFTTTSDDLRLYGKGQVRSLQEIKESKLRVSAVYPGYKYRLPTVSPVEFEGRKIIVPAYLLGAIIGDGCYSGLHYSRNVNFSAHENEQEVILRVRKEARQVNSNLRLAHTTKTGTCGFFFTQPMRDLVKSLGILGDKSETKKIPNDYIYNSVEIRLDLLRGLMDTDGYVDKSGNRVSFCSVSDQLAEQVLEIARSLGGTGTITWIKNSLKGFKSKSGGCYYVQFALDICPFYLTRKRVRWENQIAKKQNRNKRNSIMKIIKLKIKEEVRCLVIDHPSHLYVTDDYIVTHNSGKTVQQIGLAETYLERNRDAKILIVTENNRIIANAFANDAKRMKVRMNPIKKSGEMKESGIYITSYKDLRNLKDSFADVSFCIFDESHNLKNETSGKTKLGMDLMTKSKNTAVFSATPVDKPGHLAYICKAFNLNFKNVMKYLGYKKLYGQWWTNQSFETIAKKYDSVFKEFTEQGLMCKREVPLDGLLMHSDTVKLSDDYQLRYDEALKKMQRMLDYAEPKEKGLMKAQWLMKIRAILEESKIDHAMDKIQESIKEGKQVVLFASRVNDSILKDIKKDNYTKLASGTLKELATRLQKLGIKHSEVFGSKKDAADQIKSFQQGDAKVIIATPQSGSTGINLDDVVGDKPRVAIVMTPPFSATDLIQMFGRVHRLTTKSKSEVVMLNTNTEVEQWNKNIIANKLVTLGASVKGDYESISVADMEKVENMSTDDAREYFKEKKVKLSQVPVTSEYRFDLSKFKMAAGMAKALYNFYKSFVNRS